MTMLETRPALVIVVALLPSLFASCTTAEDPEEGFDVVEATIPEMQRAREEGRVTSRELVEAHKTVMTELANFTARGMPGNYSAVRGLRPESVRPAPRSAGGQERWSPRHGHGWLELRHRDREQLLSRERGHRDVEQQGATIVDPADIPSLEISARPGYPIVIVPFAFAQTEPDPPMPEGFDPKPRPFGVSFAGMACSEPRLIE